MCAGYSKTFKKRCLRQFWHYNFTVEGLQASCVHLIEEPETPWEVCHYKIMIKYQRSMSNSQKEHQRDTITIYSAAAEHQSAAKYEIC